MRRGTNLGEGNSFLGFTFGLDVDADLAIDVDLNRESNLHETS